MAILKTLFLPEKSLWSSSIISTLVWKVTDMFTLHWFLAMHWFIQQYAPTNNQVLLTYIALKKSMDRWGPGQMESQVMANLKMPTCKYKVVMDGQSHKSVQFSEVWLYFGYGFTCRPDCSLECPEWHHLVKISDHWFTHGLHDKQPPPPPQGDTIIVLPIMDYAGRLGTVGGGGGQATRCTSFAVVGAKWGWINCFIGQFVFPQKR